MNLSLRRTGYIAYAILLLALVGWFVASFPILRVPLALGFMVYAACLWRWPWLWLLAIPALLPVFDLAPWSGRFFFDEFDGLTLLTAGTLALRGAKLEPMAPLTRDTQWIVALLLVSYLGSTFIRLWPLAPITVDSFANYASPYNSLRVAKAFAWALLLLRPLQQASAQYKGVNRLLGTGFLLGLVAVGFVSLYERWLFTGVLALNTDYRTTASFSSMHTGDGPIDVWIAMTMPFLGLLLIDRRWLMLLPLTLALAALSTYALLVTLSRGPIIAIILAYSVSLAALLVTRSRHRHVSGAIFLGVGLAVLVASVGPSLMAQTSLGQRFSQIGQDAQVRLNHWRNALSLRDNSLMTEIFGMGLGSYPAIHQRRSTRELRATRYRFVSNGAEHYLTLWSGQSLYVGQDASATKNSAYAFSAKIRTSEQHAVFTVAWCELWMLTSANCTRNSFALRALPGQWQMLVQTINAKQIGTGRHIAGLFFKRPTRLTFFVGGAAETGADVGELSLKDSRGRELLQNNDFSRGSDHWFWAVDRDLQWHTLNATVDILFEQGWLGLIAVGALVFSTLAKLTREIAKGDWLSTIFLASLTGILVNGTTVSIFDQPRLALGFYLLCLTVLISDDVDGKMPKSPLTI